MTGESRVTMHKGAAALMGLALLLTGAGASYLLMRSSGDDGEQVGNMSTDAATGTSAQGAQPVAAPPVPSTGSLPDVIVSLTTEAVERAGIVEEGVEALLPEPQLLAFAGRFVTARQQPDQVGRVRAIQRGSDMGHDHTGTPGRGSSCMTYADNGSGIFAGVTAV